MMPHRDLLVSTWLLCAAMTALVFTLLPDIDLAASRVFWDGAGFPAARSTMIETLRYTLWFLSLTLIPLSLIGLLWPRNDTGARWPDRRSCAFVLSLHLIGPGLIVNAVLKAHWGRARPDQIAEFGGIRLFTPALWPADQCAGNCSFVSGEAASAAALAVSLLVLVLRLKPKLWRSAAALAILVALVGGGLRLAAGRHFLSDVIFAWLIVVGLALALDRLILRKEAFAYHFRRPKRATADAVTQA